MVKDYFQESSRENDKAILSAKKLIEESKKKHRIERDDAVSEENEDIVREYPNGKIEKIKESK